MCANTYVRFGEGSIVDWLKVVTTEYGRCIFLYVKAITMFT